MNKTANFQLTQWEKTDRIMMEDFNRDNAAIDAALKANADAITAEAAAREAAVTALASKSRFTKLGEWSLSADATTFEIPLTGIDWANWDKVHLDCGVKNGSTVTLFHVQQHHADHQYLVRYYPPPVHSGAGVQRRPHGFHPVRRQLQGLYGSDLFQCHKADF